MSLGCSIIPQWWLTLTTKIQLNSHGYYHNCNVTSDLLRIPIIIWSKCVGERGGCPTVYTVHITNGNTKSEAWKSDQEEICCHIMPWLYVYMCIYVHVYIHMCICMCIYVHTHTYKLRSSFKSAHEQLGHLYVTWPVSLNTNTWNGKVRIIS